MKIIVNSRNVVIFATEWNLVESETGFIEIDDSGNRLCEIPIPETGSYTVVEIDFIPEGMSPGNCTYIDGIFTYTGEEEEHATYNIYDRSAFLSLFTTEERTAFRASNNLLISDFRYIIEMSNEVNLSDLKVQSPMYYMFLTGILTEERLNYIFKNTEVFWTSSQEV